MTSGTFIKIELYLKKDKIDKIIEINYYLIKSIYILFLALLLCKKKAKGDK